MKLRVWSTSWNAWHRAAAIVMSGNHCDANNPAVELPQRTASPHCVFNQAGCFVCWVGMWFPGRSGYRRHWSKRVQGRWGVAFNFSLPVWSSKAWLAQLTHPPQRCPGWRAWAVLPVGWSGMGVTWRLSPPASRPQWNKMEISQVKKYISSPCFFQDFFFNASLGIFITVPLTDYVLKHFKEL